MSYLSKYLYSLRINCGYDSIAAYFKAKSLPISEVYYRALEAGKHTGKTLTMDTAVKLCKALKADERQFFLHLLKDSLPSEMFSELVRPIPLESFGDFADRQRVLEHDLEVYKKDAARVRAASSFLADNSAIHLLSEYPQWLAFVHFIYMVQETTEAALETVRSINNINESLETVLKAFVTSKIIRPIEEDAKTKKKRIRRFSPWFRLPPNNPLAQKLKNEFVRLETGKSIEKIIGNTMFDDETSFVESLIDAYSREGCSRIKKRICDLLAEVNASSESASDRDDTRAFFFCVTISPRPEYKPTNH